MTDQETNDILLTNLRGKWAQGIQPRGLTWIIKDKFAICERLGGYGSGHRPVRRQEEIVWVLNSNFNYVVSLIDGTENLRNYEELRLPYLHHPITRDDDFSRTLPKIYHEFEQRINHGERLLVHRSEMNDLMSGFVGGYLAWSGLVPTLPEITSVTERLLQRQLGPLARRMVHEVHQARIDYYTANPDGPPKATDEDGDEGVNGNETGTVSGGTGTVSGGTGTVSDGTGTVSDGAGPDGSEND